MESNSKVVVAAIDFGTTYSGWAFSFKHDYKSEPTKVNAKQWNSGQTITTKAPTAILIKPDGETLASFGYDAEANYMELASTNKHKEWYYFRHFKMSLHGKMNIDRNMKLEDETQKLLPAINVFSLVIRYMREDFLKETKDRLATGQISENEIMWVLTVPAIWDDAAKQFMREAAIMAGVKESNFMIALEPETASIYCLHLPLDKMVHGGGLSSFETGSKYMILDAGGGTIDITVHEVMPGFKLKEIYKATGGAWGGTQIDEAFKHFLIGLVGTKVFSRFKTENKEDYLDVFRAFELKKREVSPDSEKQMRIRFPSSFIDLCLEENGENLSKAIEKTIYAGQVSLSRDMLSINYSVVKSFFSETIQNIVSHVRQLMQYINVKEISSILMVGGFSESKMLQDAIKSNFINIKVIIPQEAGLAVLKGAVVFGHSPSSIAERVCKYTYGTEMNMPFDVNEHDISKRVKFDDGYVCTGIFSKHVEIGQTVVLNGKTKEQSYWPRTENQTSVGFHIYASTNKSPKYVTDEGCVKLGKVSVDILDRTVPRYQRLFVVSMSFGGTEIEVTAKEERTKNTAKVRVNFLG